MCFNFFLVFLQIGKKGLLYKIYGIFMFNIIFMEYLIFMEILYLIGKQ